MTTQVNEDLLREIDKLELSDRIRRWQKAMKAYPSQIYVDRQKLALESWRETEGEDIEIRRAKLFKKIVENVSIKIHDFDVLVGRLTPGVIGASTAIDIVGDYIPGIWNDDGKIHISVTNDGTLSRDDLEGAERKRRLLSWKNGARLGIQGIAFPGGHLGRRL